MRFYSAIRIQPQQHLNEICENPYLVFTTDFLYSLAKLHNVDWSPINISPGYMYPQHPLSPCTKNVKEAMFLIHVRSVLNYEMLYEELIPPEYDNKLELFIYRVNKVHRKLTDNPMDAFFTLMHVGRWTITFYERGTRDAAHLAPYLMADALQKTIENSPITTWFSKIDVVAQDLSELLKSDIVEGFAEEYFHYFEELDRESGDDDDFDKCHFCVCGHCEDLYGDDEVYEEENGDYDYHDCDDYDGDNGNSDTESGEFLEVIENESEDNRDDD